MPRLEKLDFKENDSTQGARLDFEENDSTQRAKLDYEENDSTQGAGLDSRRMTRLKERSSTRGK